MRWSFRTQLILAFLMFSLVPTLVMTLVTFEATEQLKDRAARVVYRNALAGARALDSSPFEKSKDGVAPLFVNARLKAVSELFGQLIQEVQIPTLRVLLIDDDMTILVNRSGREDREALVVGQRLPDIYADLIHTHVAGNGRRRTGDAPYYAIDDGVTGAEIVAFATVELREREDGAGVPYSVLLIVPRDDAFRLVNLIRNKVMMVFAGCLVATVLLGLWLGNRFVRPLALATEATRQLERGYLLPGPHSARGDELGRLLNQLNSVVGRLAEVIREIGQATNSVSTASNQLSASAQQLSQGATEQAGTLQEIASSLQTVDSSVQNNAQHAQQTAKSANEARAQAEAGGLAVQETLAAMQQIAKRIKVVEDIAYQTNLLALNAAIEAARAGAQGRGFAVVAGEVRKLAERSQTAAHQIGELAESSVKVAENAGGLLGRVVPMIRKTSDLVQEIAAASQEQTSAIHEINVGVRQLDEVVQQNVAASVELASTAESLASQAVLLEGLVGFFHLGGEPPGPGAGTASRHAPAHRPAATSHRGPGRALPSPRWGDRGRGPSPREGATGARPPGGIVVNLDDDTDFERF